MKGRDDVVSAVVPAIGTGGSLSVIRSLGRRGVHTVAVSEKEKPPSFSSRYCDERHRVPSPKTDLQGYRDSLLEFARRSDVGAIVPVREADVFVLSRDRATFAEHVGTPWPTFEQLQDVHDRHRLFDAAERAGVPIPDTRSLSDIQDWDRERIVKGRFAILTSEYLDSVPAGRCDSPAKTIFLDPGVEPDIEAIVEQMGHVPIAQEYVEGTEFCLRALYRDGEPIVTSQKKLIRGYKYSRGPSIYHEAVSLPDLEEAGLALLDELDWHGMASVGFIRDGAGDFKLLEVNPRFPASVPVDIHAGIDYPYYYWQLSLGESMDPSPVYRAGTASHLLRGELVHLHSVLREEYPLAKRPSVPGTVWDIVSSLVAHPRFDYFSLDDPAPFLRDTINTGTNLLTSS